MTHTLYHCDCCYAPMVDATHYGAGSTSAGCETSACLLCAGLGDPDTVIEEIDALGPYIERPGVADRIVKLSGLLSKGFA